MPPAKPEPGRDPGMAKRTQSLNLLFAVSSIVLMLVTSWMIWADYNREWKQYQKGFNQYEVKLTQAQVEEALGKVGAEKKQALDAELAQADQEIAARRADVRAAEAAVDKAHGVWYAVDQDYRFTKADIDVARFEYEEAAHNKLRSAERKKKHLDELEAKLGKLRLEVEDALAAENAATAALNQVKQARLAAEAKQKEVLGEVIRLEDLARKLPMRGFVFNTRNLPVLDMANPSLRVNQIMPANLYDDVIFSPTPKVDRCTTCHLGIDKKGYESAPQPYTTHPDVDTYLKGPHAMERVGCTACHQGRGRATTFVNAVHVPDTREKEVVWGKYSGTHEYERWHLWDQPMLAKGHTQSQCAKCHQGVVEVPKADKLNTGIQLVERYGCYGCHKIKGWEGIRKAGPDLSKILSKTSEDWMYQWVKEPKALRPSRMPQQWGVRSEDQATPEMALRDDAEANAAVAYLAAKSQRISYPAPPPGNLESGRKLFETIGCLACHRVGDDRRGIDGLEMASFRAHGPNLDGTGSKVNAGWLYAWIKDPKAFWHETRMPRLRLSDKEAADVTAYLMSLKSDAYAARTRPPLEPAQRDTMVREYLLAQFSTKESDQKLAAMSDAERTLFLGERTIFRGGCFGCHNIPGFENTMPIGTELTEQGSKLVERLDFGYEHDIPHTLPGWLHRKFMEPRTFDRGKNKKPDELLRMPKFHFKPEEADAIVTAILSFTKEQIPLAAQRQLSADERYVQKGARMVRDLNCQGCHQIGALGGNIRKIVEDQLETSGGDVLQGQALSPPLLYNHVSKIGQGSRARVPWLHDFLKDPSNTVRPWLEVRMPTFDFDEAQINTVAHYFAALDGVPFPYDPQPKLDATMVAHGKDLFNRWQCVKCHVVAGRLPAQDPANMAPDLALVPRRLRADWLDKWLADPGRIAPGTRMPANFPVAADENAFPEILGGDQKKQIEAVRSYLLTLGSGGSAAGK